MEITINIVNSGPFAVQPRHTINIFLFFKKNQEERGCGKKEIDLTCLCFWLICRHSRRKYSWNKIKMDLQFLDFQGLHVSYVPCEPAVFVTLPLFCRGPVSLFSTKLEYFSFNYLVHLYLCSSFPCSPL
jgi:hypothetical protein